MLNLYKNIRERRIELKMSQDTLAELTGYRDRSSIAKIEKGEVDISESKIREFAKALKVSPGELMGWEANSDSMYYFKNYIESLGYRIQQDDPEHRPYIITDEEAIRLEYGTIQRVKDRVDTYTSLTLNTELGKLKEQEIRCKRADSERLAKCMLQAAHNDYENEPEERERMKSDLDNLKRPE